MCPSLPLCLQPSCLPPGVLRPLHGKEKSESSWVGEGIEFWVPTSLRLQKRKRYSFHFPPAIFCKDDLSLKEQVWPCKEVCPR